METWITWIIHPNPGLTWDFTCVGIYVMYIPCNHLIKKKHTLPSQPCLSLSSAHNSWWPEKKPRLMHGAGSTKCARERERLLSEPQQHD